MKANRVLWWGAFLFVSAFALLASLQFDAPMQAWITHHQSPGMKTFMRGVSRIGDWPGHAIIGLTLLLVARLLKSKKWMRIFLAMLIALALAGAGARVIKIAAGRARPDVQSETQWLNGLQISSRFNAFPSGHTAASTAFFATLLFASWRIGLPCMAIPLLVAFSRIYVAAHHLSDVVGAAIVGLIAAYFVAHWTLPKNPPPRAEIRS